MYGARKELFGKIMGLGPREPNIKSSSSSSESPLLLLLLRRENRPRRLRLVPDKMLESVGLVGFVPEMAARRRGLLVLRFMRNSE